MYTAARLAFTGRAAVFLRVKLPHKNAFNRPALLLHLLCQKGRRHCHGLALGVLRAGGAVLGQQTPPASTGAAHSSTRGAPSQGSRVFSGAPGLW